MEEQSETPKILDELSKSNLAKASGRTSRQTQIARRRIVLVLILLLPLLGGAVFLGYQQFLLQSRLANLADENLVLNSALAGQTSQIQQLQQDLEDAHAPVVQDDSAIRALETGLNEEIARLRQQLTVLQQQQTSANEALSFEWKIAEAEYLLGLANRKLSLEADPGSAITLIESADAALVESRSNSVLTVRQAISADLALLRGTVAINREEVFSRIENLIVQVEAIDLMNSMRENFENRQAIETQPRQIDTANGVWDSSLAFLGTIFVWRKWDDRPETMMAPGQETFIRQNLHLMLQQAQLALLMRDNKLYQRSLNNSRDWIQRYTLTEAAAGQVLLTGIDELSALDINPPLPTLDQTLQTIHQLTSLER